LLSDVGRSNIPADVEQETIPFRHHRRFDHHRLVGVIKPALANTLGELGKNISLFVFEGKNKDGSRRLVPMKPGGFTVTLNGEEFRWRLPLGSLLPDKSARTAMRRFPAILCFAHLTQPS
jgi:hypothetical protein